MNIRYPIYEGVYRILTHISTLLDPILEISSHPDRNRLLAEFFNR